MNTSISMLTQIWDRSLKKIEEQLGEKQVFDSFFAGSYIYDVSGNTIVVVVANSLASAIIKAKYYDLVVSVVNEITGNNYSFEFVLQQDVKNRDTSVGVSVTPIANKQEYFADAKLKEELTFDNFVVGAFNREAAHAASARKDVQPIIHLF